MDIKNKAIPILTYLILAFSLITFGFTQSPSTQSGAICKECIFSGGDSTCSPSTTTSRCKSYTDGRCEDTPWCSQGEDPPIK